METKGRTPNRGSAKGPMGLPTFSGESGRLLGMGLELGLLIGGLAYLGYYLDGRYGTAPWLAFTGVMLAMVGGTYNLAKVLLKPTKKPTKKPAKQSKKPPAP